MLIATLGIEVGRELELRFLFEHGKP